MERRQDRLDFAPVESNVVHQGRSWSAAVPMPSDPRWPTSRSGVAAVTGR
jgi:hypothetical protein